MNAKVKNHPKISEKANQTVESNTNRIANKLASREQEVENILRVLDESTPTILCITAPFGSGKTHFVKMLIESVEKKNETRSQKYAAIYFDAWKYDFWDNPLSSFIEELAPVIFKKETDEVKSAYGKLKDASKVLALPVVTMAAFSHPVLMPLLPLIKQLIKVADKASPPNKLSESECLTFNQDFALTEKIKQFKHELKNYVKTLGFKKLYIFIDELDRCKPSFALAFLEIIKHIMNDGDDLLPDVSYIFTIDKNQLSESIKHTYGNNIDVDGYLRRFFKQAYKLNQNHNLNDLCAELLKIPKYEKLKNFVSDINEIVNLMQLDPRSVEIFFHALNSALAMESELFARKATEDSGCFISERNQIKFGQIWYAYIFLLAFKLKNKKIYEQLTDPYSAEKNEQGQKIKYSTKDFNERMNLLSRELTIEEGSNKLSRIRMFFQPYSRWGAYEPGDIGKYFRSYQGPMADPETRFVGIKQSIDQLEFF